MRVMIEHASGDIGARLAQVDDDGGSLAAEAMLGRVLEGVLDQPVEPVKAGRYVILEAIGRGGLGEVHAAYDPELDRKVAIKLVRAGIEAWDDLERRMLREAQAMAKVRHPNVVAIHDVGRFRDQVFIAMELVEGRTLSAWMREQPRTWMEVRDVFLQAGRGLAAVHDAGLVQRDFKPANVLVGNDGVVKVLDFGLARAVAEQRGERAALGGSGPSLLDEELTRAGVVAGTPAYMAPEQAFGEHVDAAADQFAFCVAMYEALWGERPFPGTDLAERQRAIEAQQLDPPATVPTWLRLAVLGGLATEPHARHPSMHALLAELDRDRKRRTRTWIAVGVAALLSAFATSAAFVLYEPEVTPQMLAEIDALAEQAHDAAKAHHFVYPPLDSPRDPTAYSRTLALEHIEGPAADTARERAAELRHEFSTQLTELGDAYADKEGGGAFAADFYAAAVLFDADNEHARERSLLTAAQLAALEQRVEQGELGTAELVAGESLAALAEPDEDERRRKVARLQRRRPDAPASTMASLDALVGRASEPEPEPKGVDDRPNPSVPGKRSAADPPAAKTGDPEAAPERSDPREATRLAKEGLAALHAHELDRAETLLHRAIASDRNNATALGGLAQFHFELGRYPKAAKYAQRAVAAAPRVARHHMILGDAYFKELRFEDARKAYKKAHELGAKGAQRALDRVAAKLGE